MATLTEAQKAKARETRCRWKKANQEKLKEQRHQRYLANREKVLEQSRQWQEANRERVKERAQQYYLSNRARILEQNRQWRETNSERMKELVREWTDANPERVATNQKRWAEANSGKIREKDIFRRVGKRCPPWVDREELALIYAACPKGWHVDHIVPLNGRTVCGLHVPWNLQFLTPSDNRRKHNKVQAA